ncbi:DUF4215 domain-containing protein [Myxococcota bacterium]
MAVSCSASTGEAPLKRLREKSTGGSGAREPSGGGSQAADTGDPLDLNKVDQPGPPTAGCSDGLLTEDEACDDGNLEDGDGCAANCRSLEPGWSCSTPGAPCIRIARCGDGFTAFPELCDDGNSQAGDGCSGTCKVEVGHKCEGSPSVCTPTVCGDGVQEGAESCEDDDGLPFDGCSIDCQVEPDCSAGACASECGDGLVLGEECDDGNHVDGDGCSADCRQEVGYVCVVPQPSGHMDVPAIFRDFRADHPDFEPIAPGRHAPVLGMVENRLDASGKPAYVAVDNSLVTSSQTFAEWYRDVPGTNSTTVTTFTLWDAGDGRFVNRWGANGEQWLALSGESEHWCGNVGEEVDGEPCTSIHGAQYCDQHRDEIYRCEQRNGAHWGIFIEAEHDGNPVFFPVDHDSFSPRSERRAALISTYYGGNWDQEEGAPRHNFHFTSEVRYWFQYAVGQTYVLDFTGDDDVWVFINGRLAVDVGGVHTAVNGHLVVNQTGTASVSFAVTEGSQSIPRQTVDLGLQDGHVYEIAVFHAERQTEASTFKLTLEGFAMARSECGAVCGDGLVSLGEECDDGENSGGYGKCGPGCRLGDFCGDGIQQEGEQCDDGNNIDGDGCGSGCRNIVVY